MTFWMVIAVLGVIAMIVGPIAMMQPNVAQRRQEALRKQAQQLGLVVSMQRPPPRGGQTPERLVPIYRLPGEHETSWQLALTDYIHGAHVADYWEKTKGELPTGVLGQKLASLLSSVPKGIETLGQDARGVYVYWRELGGESGLAQVHRFLQDVEEICHNN